MSTNRRIHARNVRFYMLILNVAFMLIFNDRAHQAALDRERAGQHKTVSLLHDLLASRPAAPAGSGGQQPQAASGTGHQPADAAGNGTSRRQAPR